MDRIREIFDALAAPFENHEISWRVGRTNEKHRGEGQNLRGQPFCYIDARTVMDRLDAVVGPENWQCTYTPGVGQSIVCNIGICLQAEEWIWKADGAGPSDMEADKGALSDAFKRAAVRFGIGRYLYNIEADWFDLDPKTKQVAKEQKPQLDAIHEEYARKAGWGSAEQAAVYRALLVALKESKDLKLFALNNKRLIESFPPAMRKHLEQTIANEKAAA